MSLSTAGTTASETLTGTTASSSTGAAPSPPAQKFDIFGIAQLYPSADSGLEWNSDHWNNTKPRNYDAQTFDPLDPTGASQIRGTNFITTIDGSGHMIFGAGSDPTQEVQPRFYLNHPSYFFKNVEATVYYMRESDRNVPYSGAVIGTRSSNNGHSDPAQYCNAHTYYARMRVDGTADFAKELHHNDAIPGISRNVNWDNGFGGGATSSAGIPENQWIGIKYITTNIANDSRVHLELYRDITGGLNGGTWEPIMELDDTGDWNALVPGVSCPYASNYVPLQGGGVVMLRNTQVIQTKYKWFSVREIDIRKAATPDTAFPAHIAEPTTTTSGAASPYSTRHGTVVVGAASFFVAALMLFKLF